MKKVGILNSNISKVISFMGHTDTICIADCGLPIPENVKRIDLALKFGVPTFIDTLKEVASNMKIEKVILAKEIKEFNKNILEEIEELFGKNCEIEFLSHNEFKSISKNCKAIIRTGEASPYANIILQSGCIF